MARDSKDVAEVERQAQERLLLGPDYADHDLVFARPDGRRSIQSTSPTPSSAPSPATGCPASAFTT
jgi:hypothetical protein